MNIAYLLQENQKIKEYFLGKFWDYFHKVEQIKLFF